MTDEARIRQAENELWALRKEVRAKRKTAKQTEGKLATAFREAMRFWDQLKAKGGTLTDLADGLEHVLRGAWQAQEVCRCHRCLTLCPYCQDTGARYEKRPARLYGGMLLDVVVPCSCERGRQFRPKPERSAEDFTAAGKSKPTRVGR